MTPSHIVCKVVTDTEQDTDTKGDTVKYEEANRYVNNLFYKNDWSFHLIEDPDVFRNPWDSRPDESTGYAYLVVVAKLVNSARENVVSQFGVIRYGSAISKGGLDIRIPIGLANTQVELERLIFEALLEIEKHETREFLRRRDTLDAPFHPHREEGDKAYGDTFSVALEAKARKVLSSR